MKKILFITMLFCAIGLCVESEVWAHPSIGDINVEWTDEGVGLWIHALVNKEDQYRYDPTHIIWAKIGYYRQGKYNKAALNLCSARHPSIPDLWEWGNFIEIPKAWEIKKPLEVSIHWIRKDSDPQDWWDSRSWGEAQDLTNLSLKDTLNKAKFIKISREEIEKRFEGTERKELSIQDLKNNKLDVEFLEYGFSGSWQDGTFNQAFKFRVIVNTPVASSRQIRIKVSYWAKWEEFEYKQFEVEIPPQKSSVTVSINIPQSAMIEWVRRGNQPVFVDKIKIHVSETAYGQTWNVITKTVEPKDFTKPEIKVE